MKTFDEVEKYLHGHAIKGPIDLFDIEDILEKDGLELPENLTIHSCGITKRDFISWYKDELPCPKTYEECKDIIVKSVGCDCNPSPELMLSGIPVHEFCMLLVARNAYWVIAGEQLNLGKSWEPEWETTDRKYSIYNYRGTIKHDYFTVVDRQILVFPTEEMRNIFYRNFKDLIEVCKDLL